MKSSKPSAPSTAPTSARKKTPIHHKSTKSYIHRPNRSYRIAQNSVDVIDAASKLTGVSMGKIIEECVTEAIDTVTERLLRAEFETRRIQIEKLANIRKISRPRALKRQPTSGKES